MADDATPAVKAGAKTSEFWLHLVSVILGVAATLLGLVISVKKGEIDSGSALTTAIGVVMTALTACGYSNARAIVKSSGVLLLALLLASSSGCSSEKKQEIDMILEARDLLLDPKAGDVIDGDWQARRFVFLTDTAPVDTRGRSE